MVRTVRDLALGLRPSMLDDFGLQPALEWHVRDFTRRYGLPVDLTVSGRAARAAGAVRHLRLPHRAGGTDQLRPPRRRAPASASTVDRQSQTPRRRRSTDDGVGIQSEPAARAGLGLRGIEERVRDLGGTSEIDSTPAAGTSLTIQIPLPPMEPREEVEFARIAG